MSICSQLLETSDPRWRQALDLVPHDVYHQPAYLEATARHEGGHPLLLHCWSDAFNGHLLIPLLVRPLPQGLNAPPTWRDATCPYGYGSPTASDHLTCEELESLQLAAFDSLRAAKIVSLFCRSHPVLRQPVRPLDTHTAVQRHCQTVLMSLHDEDSEQWRELRTNHRRDINRLLRAGFAFSGDNWQELGDFVSLYHETMQRANANSFYFFPRSYYADLRRGLSGSNVRLYSVVAPNGEIAAAAIFFVFGGLAQYHLGATANASLSHSPLKLLIWSVARQLVQEGIETLHLGGGVGGKEDSLFRFKEGFSKRLAPFSTIRVILDPDWYDWLCRHAEVQDDSYFPRYRATSRRPPASSTVTG